MIIDKIVVPEDDMLKLEQIHFKYNSRKDTFAYLVDLKSKDSSFIGSEQYEQLVNELADLFKEYTNVKNEITIKYIPEKYLLEDKFNWEADFPSRTLVIKE